MTLLCFSYLSFSLRNSFSRSPSFSPPFSSCFLSALSLSGQPHPPCPLSQGSDFSSTKPDQITLDVIHHAIPAWSPQRLSDIWVPVKCLYKSEWQLPLSPKIWVHHSTQTQNRLKPLMKGTYIPCTQVVFWFHLNGLRLCSLPELSRKPDLLLRGSGGWGGCSGLGGGLAFTSIWLCFLMAAQPWALQPHLQTGDGNGSIDHTGLLRGWDGMIYATCLVWNTGCIMWMMHFYIDQILQRRRQSTFDMLFSVTHSPPSLSMEQFMNQFSLSHPWFYFWPSTLVFSSALDQLELASYNLTPGRKRAFLQQHKKIFFYQ